MIARASRATACTMLGCALAVWGCHDIIGPLPHGAIRFAPPPEYSRWWVLTETCSGRSGDFAAYEWYVVPGNSVSNPNWGEVDAYTDVEAHRVVLSAASQDDGGIVRHEMLHALLGREYAVGDLARMHPPAYFQGRCAGVVTCPEKGCRDAGPAPVDAPADAAALPSRALDLHVEVLGNPMSRTHSDTVMSIVVSVTNPTTEPVWVQLDSTPDATGSWRHWSGFRVVSAGLPVPLSDLSLSDSAGFVSWGPQRVPFAAGQTHRLVVDVPARWFAAGDYLVVGIFNTRQVWTPLTITP